jgi:hypothetical protein
VRLPRNATKVTSLKADCRACRYVEPQSSGRLTVEFERAVHLVKMIVRSDLHRAVARVRDLERHRHQSPVQFDFAARGKYLSGNHIRPLTE